MVPVDSLLSGHERTQLDEIVKLGHEMAYTWNGLDRNEIFSVMFLFA